MFNRRSILLSACALLVAVGLVGLQACTQAETKNSLNVGMVLEPPGLDPTVNAASAVGEVVLYNVFETLTKIQSDGTVQPLLAEKWEASPDQKVWTFHLRRDAKFHNGAPFNAAAVQFAFARAASAQSTNKDKTLFTSFERIDAPDAYTVVLHRSLIPI